MTRRDRYPEYDVLAKRDTPSWNDATRRVIDERLATPLMPRFFTDAEWAVADALVRRILPVDANAVPLVALLDAKLLANHGDGFRDADMPYMREAWRQSLAALDRDARAQYEDRGFAALSDDEQDAMLRRLQEGKASAEHWHGVDPKKFFTRRVLVDVPALYFRRCTTASLPHGTRSGLAAPPARAAMSVSKATAMIPGKPSRPLLMPGRIQKARSTVSSDPCAAPRATAGRAPDVFRVGGWVPMREYAGDDAVDFVIVGTGAGGGTLAALLAEQGFSVVAFDAGAYFRPLEDFASDESEQNKLYWTDDGLANSSGLVGKNLMTQSNQAVWGLMDEDVRWYKGPPSLAITEHWNYDDRKDFHGGYCWMGQGPLPNEWASVQTGARGLWGQRLRDAMLDYNHMIGVKMVGEMLPDEANRVTLADDVDQYGLRVARITYRWGDNDKALIAHALEQMGRSIEAIGARDIFRQEDDTNHLGGTVRMGSDRETSVVDADCRSWDVRNLWVCDGSVFPTVGGVNPALTIQTIAMRTAERITQLASAGELHAH